jgi:hypothetical protein
MRMRRHRCCNQTMSRKRSTVAGLIAAGLVSAFALGAAPATAKPKISGKLDARGYTVIALASGGEARVDYAPNGKFSLRSPAKKVTLQLRDPDGRYGGPVVLAVKEHGDRAVVGVKGGADLGAIDVRASKGYAKVKNPPKHAIDEDRLARSKNGIPKGARKFGLVKSKTPKEAPKGDPDFDGVPNPLDIDDDGDLILDAKDGAKAPSARVSESYQGLGITLELNGSGDELVNVNGGSTDAQIDAVLPRLGLLGVHFSGIDAGSGELDCGVLVYCSPGGTGRLSVDEGTSVANSPAFPECCDADEDGLGTLVRQGAASADATHGPMFLFPGATTDQIRAGDVLIEHAKVNGTTTDSTASVGLVFSTMPVLASYDDGHGNAAAFSYGPGTGRPGSFSNPAPVSSGQDGIKLALKLWRPQRKRIAGEPGAGKWQDVGHLAYLAAASIPGGPAAGGGKVPGGGGYCPQSTLSSNDSDLTAYKPPSMQEDFPGLGGFLDSAPDLPSDAANKVAFNLDLTRCLASHGRTANPGSKVQVLVEAYALDPDGTFSQATADAAFQVQP